MRRFPRLALVALAIAAAASVIACSSSSAATPVSGGTSVTANRTIQPGPTVIRCEATSRTHPKTLWLGQPSTHGIVYQLNCDMTLHGNVITLTLPGTKAHTSYRLGQFRPAKRPEKPFPFPKLTGNRAVTLTFKNGIPELKAGGPDRLVGADIEIPKYLGSVLIVQAGHHTYKFTIFYMG